MSLKLPGPPFLPSDPTCASPPNLHRPLDILAIIRADVGDLVQIVSVEKLNGFVRSSPTFTERPYAIDGASDLWIELLWEPGRHARTAIGVAQLPFGAAVQLEMVLGLRSRS